MPVPVPPTRLSPCLLPPGQPFPLALLGWAPSNVTFALLFGQRFRYQDPVFLALMGLIDEVMVLLGSPGVQVRAGSPSSPKPLSVTDAPAQREGGPPGSSTHTSGACPGVPLADRRVSGQRGRAASCGRHTGCGRRHPGLWLSGRQLTGGWGGSWAPAGARPRARPSHQPGDPHSPAG